jgi:transposase
MQFDAQSQSLVGPGGTLPIRDDDEVARKLAMLIEGECEGVGPGVAAEKYGLSRQRYSQLRAAFKERGAEALRSQRRGPKGRSRRTDMAVRQVIRQRFLDPDASVAVIAQKLRQVGLEISTRSVERVIEEFGLQKKTL